jgi:hypothetical protein
MCRCGIHKIVLFASQDLAKQRGSCRLSGNLDVNIEIGGARKTSWRALSVPRAPANTGCVKLSKVVDAITSVDFVRDFIIYAFPTIKKGAQ